MKEAVLDYLACPACAADLDLSVDAREGDEIMTGALACTGCDAVYPVAGGVPRFTAMHSRGHEDTARAFGYQWKRYTNIDDRYRRQFLDWIRPVDADFFRGKVVLEGGCGKGRHTVLAAEFGAKAVLAVDLSEAVDTAFANTRHLPNAHVIQADLNHPPVKPVADYAFSVGVLHHLPDPERGFHALVSKLRPGGHISAWVYGREGNGWIVHLVTPAREKITSKLPYRALEPLATALTLPLWAATQVLYRPARGTALEKALPYGAYLGYISDLGFHEQRTIVFDHLVAPIAYYLRRDEFAGWFDRAGLDAVRIEPHNANSWRGFAQARASG